MPLVVGTTLISWRWHWLKLMTMAIYETEIDVDHLPWFVSRDMRVEETRPNWQELRIVLYENPLQTYVTSSTYRSPHVISLELSWCWYVTDEGLASIVNRCRNIQRLILIGLHELTGKPLENTVERLPRLTYLDLCNCNAIIDDIMINLARKFSYLSIVNYYGDVIE